MYKSVFSSATFWGIMISVVSKLFIALGAFDGLDEQFASDLSMYLSIVVPTVIGFVGDGIALRGRWNASRPLAVNPAKKEAITTANEGDVTSADSPL